MKSIFSIDVEDWFHILEVPSTPPLSEWAALPSKIETNFLKLLDLFDEKGVSTTCFFLGWVGERFPRLVRDAERRGHEIASHGYAHRVVHELSEAEFYSDVRKSRAILENIAGAAVIGFRAAGFSATKAVPWFFPGLAEAGYRYDSSVFPGDCEHGGIRNSPLGSYMVHTPAGPIREFPITVARILGTPICVFGGGHLRVAPMFLIEAMMRQVLREGRPPICYVHPREIDPDHPRLEMSARRRFKSYANLRTTRAKIERLLSRFEFTTFRHYLDLIESESELESNERRAIVRAGA